MFDTLQTTTVRPIKRLENHHQNSLSKTIMATMINVHTLLFLNCGISLTATNMKLLCSYLTASDDNPSEDNGNNENEVNNAASTVSTKTHISKETKDMDDIEHEEKQDGTNQKDNM